MTKRVYSAGGQRVRPAHGRDRLSRRRRVDLDADKSLRGDRLVADRQGVIVIGTTANAAT
jgi:hypothetical protein